MTIVQVVVTEPERSSRVALDGAPHVARRRLP